MLIPCVAVSLFCVLLCAEFTCWTFMCRFHVLTPMQMLDLDDTSNLKMISLKIAIVHFDNSECNHYRGTE